MQGEIKEILEDYKQLAGEITEKLDNTAEYESWLIIQEYFDKLLNNITNLQEENEYFNHCDEEKRKIITNLRYKIERLEEDNKQLKELCNKYEEEHKTTFEEWKKVIQANKKAIEYIELGLANEEEAEELLDILKRR